MIYLILDIEIKNCAFAHTAMTGVIVTSSSNVVMERNVFSDIGKYLSILFQVIKINFVEFPNKIGYHGILSVSDLEYENITISNNYMDGTGGLEII